MKSLNKVVIVICSVFAMVSCQEEIDLKMKDSARKNVVEVIGNVADSLLIAYVSKTSPYFGEEDLEAVINAQVSITKPDGTREMLPGVGNGAYLLPLAFTDFEKPYTISVSVDGEIDSARSTVPQKVMLDSLSIEEATGFLAQFGGRGEENKNKKVYMVNCFFYDLPGNNYYRLQAYHVIDSQLVKIGDGQAIQLFDDSYFNQKSQVKMPLIVNLLPGENILVELQTMDQASYKYFLTLMTTIQSAGGTFSVPENPKNNFNNSLGYFAILNSDKKWGVAPFPVQ